MQSAHRSRTFPVCFSSANRCAAVSRNNRPTADALLQWSTKSELCGSHHLLATADTRYSAKVDQQWNQQVDFGLMISFLVYRTTIHTAAVINFRHEN